MADFNRISLNTSKSWDIQALMLPLRKFVPRGWGSRSWHTSVLSACLRAFSLCKQMKSFKNPTKKQVFKKLNLAVKYSTTSWATLKVFNLHVRYNVVVGFSDASFANNNAISSQLGDICFLYDNFGKVLSISFRSYKTRKMTRSAMAAKEIILSDLVYVAFTFSVKHSTVLYRLVQFQLLTSSKSLFDIISKSSSTSARWMMLDISTAQDAFRYSVISDIGLVTSSHKAADSLIKCKSHFVAHFEPRWALSATTEIDY